MVVTQLYIIVCLMPSQNSLRKEVFKSLIMLSLSIRIAWYIYKDMPLYPRCLSNFYGLKLKKLGLSRQRLIIVEQTFACFVLTRFPLASRLLIESTAYQATNKDGQFDCDGIVCAPNEVLKTNCARLITTNKALIGRRRKSHLLP
jgi:hypothetical protein